MRLWGHNPCLGLFVSVLFNPPDQTEYPPHQINQPSSPHTRCSYLQFLEGPEHRKGRILTKMTSLKYIGSMFSSAYVQCWLGTCRWHPLCNMGLCMAHRHGDKSIADLFLNTWCLKLLWGVIVNFLSFWTFLENIIRTCIFTKITPPNQVQVLMRVCVFV